MYMYVCIYTYQCVCVYVCECVSVCLSVCVSYIPDTVTGYPKWRARADAVRSMHRGGRGVGPGQETPYMGVGLGFGV